MNYHILDTLVPPDVGNDILKWYCLKSVIGERWFVFGSSSNCPTDFILIKRWWLSVKDGDTVWVEALGAESSSFN